MTIPSGKAAVFDINNTLASVRLSASGDRIDEINVYPGVQEILQGLVEDGVRLGVVRDPCVPSAASVHEVLEDMGILHLFDDSLIRFGSELSPAGFREAATLDTRSIQDSEPSILYVGADASERAHAKAAGFRTAPHLALARPLVNREAALRYFRLRLLGDTHHWRTKLSDHAVASIYLSPSEPDGSCVLYAIADERTLSSLADLGIITDPLGPVDAPEVCDAYFVRTVNQAHGGVRTPLVHLDSESLAPYLLDVTKEGLIVALPTGGDVSSLHLRNVEHGDPVKLIPSVVLLDPGPPIPTGAAITLTKTSGDASLSRILDDAEVEVLTRCIVADVMARDVARYAGTNSSSEDRHIRSRHILHPGNACAVAALAYDLTQAGPEILRVRRECFRHEKRDLENVVAVLPRSIDEARAGIVIVGAHLDSTATDQPYYRPATDPAPGADDDASGIAGVLAAARACAELATSGIRHREIRFVLFNAEEVGLAGSGVYADRCRKDKEVIIAMFQMDMIGHDRASPRTFELHAGLVPPGDSDGVVLQAASKGLADLIARLRLEVSGKLAAPQIFASRNDPAVEHSDHSRFHFLGYPACLASEDFFPGRGDPGDRNPHYHRPTDTCIDADYAADIARAVAAAAWVMATR
jgi:hypothetical protein